MGTSFERSGPASGPVVTGFLGRGFKVDGQIYPGGVRLTPLAATGWEAGPIEALDTAQLADLLSLAPLPEFLLLGTGPALVRPPPALARALEEQGIGLEAMDSRAAARAWAVLRAEDRWIAAALMPL